MWDGQQEKELTSQIYSKIRSRIIDGTIEGFKIIENTNGEKSDDDWLTITAAEKAITGLGTPPDFIISKYISSGHGKKQKSIIMMIQFGIGHEVWWKKQDQVLLYVEWLLRNQNRNETSLTEAYTLDGPILLTIITVHPPTNAAAAEPAMDVRFGMFLCTRKNSPHDYRISLLWRTETRTTGTQCGGASTQLGKVLYAARICAFLREQDAKVMESYEYLGPNCCRFDTLVRTYLESNGCVVPFAFECECEVLEYLYETHFLISVSSK